MRGRQERRWVEPRRRGQACQSRRNRMPITPRTATERVTVTPPSRFPKFIADLNGLPPSTAFPSIVDDSHAALEERSIKISKSGEGFWSAAPAKKRSTFPGAKSKGRGPCSTTCTSLPQQRRDAGHGHADARPRPQGVMTRTDPFLGRNFINSESTGMSCRSPQSSAIHKRPAPR